MENKLKKAKDTSPHPITNKLEKENKPRWRTKKRDRELQDIKDTLGKIDHKMNKLEQKTENNKEARTEMSQLITYLLNEQKSKKSTSPEHPGSD